MVLERKVGAQVPSEHSVLVWLVEAVGDFVTTHFRGQDGRTGYEKEIQVQATRSEAASAVYNLWDVAHGVEDGARSGSADAGCCDMVKSPDVRDGCDHPETFVAFAMPQEERRILGSRDGAVFQPVEP